MNGQKEKVDLPTLVHDSKSKKEDEEWLEDRRTVNSGRKKEDCMMMMHKQMIFWKL
jgi:hypothetical protein